LELKKLPFSEAKEGGSFFIISALRSIKAHFRRYTFREQNNSVFPATKPAAGNLI
jgi:hypothetical protein